MNILLEKALSYAKRGWYVFPCREVPSEPFFDKELGEERFLKAKSPYTKHGFEESTLDEQTIRKWWAERPLAAIGIDCGCSGLVVIDIDVKDGRRGFDNFMRLNISDEGALHALTPSGGTHIIYSGKTESHANIVGGIDLRSKGAYIIAPPSQILFEGVMTPYIELDNWEREPISLPSDALEKLNVFRDAVPDGKRKSGKPFEQTLTHEQIVEKAEKALNRLPQEYCDEYFMWIRIGLSLKDLGDDGFRLWDNWSKKSSKYNASACKYRWNKFRPRSISIGTLFYLAKSGA